MTAEDHIQRILKACRGLRVDRWPDDGYWITVPAKSDRGVMNQLRRVYNAFPPGCTFMIRFFHTGYSGGNQSFTTGKDPFPDTYYGRKVRAVNEDMAVVLAPPGLMETLHNLTNL